MDHGLLALGAGILAVLLLQCAVLIVLLRRKSAGDSEKLAVLADRLSQTGTTVSEEFARSRREQSLFQEQMRREMRQELSATAQQIEALRADNFDQMRRMQESNDRKLDEMRATVDEKLTATLGTRLDASFRAVSQQLESVYRSLGEMRELSGGMTQSITSLNRVLSNVKVRGTWAEVQLRGILEQTIPGRFVENYAPDPLSRERVEFAVSLPTGTGETVYLPIDSKFPMEDYVRFCEYTQSGDAAAADAARKALEAVVLQEAKTVRKYIRTPQTTPFAVLYLATEGLYAEILSSRSGIAERMQREWNVMPAGPSTITALLHSLAVGFGAIAVNEKADEVRRVLADCRRQYDTFGEVLQKARRKIDEAGRSLDEAQDRNRIIAGKLKSFESIEAE